MSCSTIRIDWFQPLGESAYRVYLVTYFKTK